MDTQNTIIGLGTAAIGRPQYINIKQENTTSISLDNFEKQGWNTLEYAYQQGIRYYDTAPGYGLAEKLLMDWVINKNDPTIEVATKWGYTYTANFDPNAIQHEIKEHSLSKLNEQWETSKQLLPYLKIYQIHSATFESGVLENKEVLNKLAELKATHNLKIGITTSGNNQVDVIKKALDVEIENQALIDVFQVTYNILDQSLSEIMPRLKNDNKKVVIKEALANGRLFTNKKYPHYQELYSSLIQLSEKYNVDVDAIALRFCADMLQPFKILSGAAIEDHVKGNLKVNQFQLESEDIKLLQSFKVNVKTYWSERKKLSWN
ncbi:aldo/keto reductase [Aquimarina sp. 2201CG5-10]|uniref:aldo/keto reductase n=1 Tax=Aquimarina callyspongiae TaxID=3098150 RepID=UPI002AB442E6|nr:aldo/keto reductase [Aquimarina sp. 2201CG5-10]MDY8137923.1 aldo/keto reductase [Aquimarina sp. 2201CG5-10]